MEAIKKLGIKKENFVMLALAGVLILVILMPVEKKPSSPAKEETAPETKASYMDKTDDVQVLESRLAKMLSYVEGAGSIKVMITLKSSEEQMVLKDTTAGEYESEEITVYLTDSEGNKEPYVVKRMEPAVEGVVVAAAGAGRREVKENIEGIIQALFDIAPHKIRVVKMKTIK